MFFSLHPIQPCVQSGKNKLDFKRIYFKELPNGGLIKRKWISYCKETNLIHCSNCMAYGVYGKYGEVETKFISGYDFICIHLLFILNYYLLVPT